MWGKCGVNTLVTVRQYNQRTKKISIQDGRNCWFKVEETKSGSMRAYWMFRYQLNGRRREMTLVPTELRTDRQIIDSWRNLLAQGIDPKEAKAPRKAVDLKPELAPPSSGPTFKQAAKACEKIRLNNSRAERFAGKFIKRLENHAYSKIGNRPVAEIDRDDVLRVIEPIWYEKNPTAQKLLTDISYVLGYAISEGWREPGLNPTAWKHNLEFKLTQAQRVHTVENHPSMPYEDLPAFVAKLNQHNSIGATFVHFCILSGIRNGTVRQSEWHDYDLDKNIWHIPETKNGKSFSVPLTNQMIALLKRMEVFREGNYVFPQDRDPKKPVSENCGTSHLKKVWGFKSGEITMHGFRSTFSTYMNDQPGLDPKIIDACIEHRMGDPIEQAYNRSGWLKKRRDYMTVWNDYCWSSMV